MVTLNPHPNHPHPTTTLSLSQFLDTYIYRGLSIENHHVLTCIGNRENGAFIPDNFNHVLISAEIMILPSIFVKMIWI